MNNNGVFVYTTVVALKRKIDRYKSSHKVNTMWFIVYIGLSASECN